MAVGAEPKNRMIDDPADWVDEYGDMMLHYALARVGRPELAEDLVQETFLAAWRGRASFDQRSSFSTWLVSILRRKIADHYRKTKREVPQSAEVTTVSAGQFFTDRGKWAEAATSWRETPDQLVEDAEFWEVLLDCTSAMPDHLAQAFRLRELGLASMSEICRIAEITPKNLSVRLHRARLLLRQCLDRNWFEGVSERN